MKYIVYWEFDPKDIEKVVKKSNEARTEREKGTGKFPTEIFPSHSIGGQAKGFAVYEATPEQIATFVMFYMPELKVKFVPIVESIKLIEKM